MLQLSLTTRLGDQLKTKGGGMTRRRGWDDACCVVFFYAEYPGCWDLALCSARWCCVYVVCMYLYLVDYISRTWLGHNDRGTRAHTSSQSTSRAWWQWVSHDMDIMTCGWHEMMLPCVLLFQPNHVMACTYVTAAGWHIMRLDHAEIGVAVTCNYSMRLMERYAHESWLDALCGWNAVEISECWWIHSWYKIHT